MSEGNVAPSDGQKMLITKESLRPGKRQRTRSTTSLFVETHDKGAKDDDMKDPTVEQQDKDTDTTVTTKNRRQSALWSDDDVVCFFRGLAEHGKDFASIQLYMKKKQRSKHADDKKTKEQIRHFYHRTWSKLFKLLNLGAETNQKKANRRELHYMLCLGELRKKGTKGTGQKVVKQLHELVTKGSTYIRQNGRNVRVRPPNRYLRKLYSDENSVEDVLLPKHINIEFLPNSNSAFNYVQMNAFNPRIRFVNVNINSKFSEVFDLFDKRFTDLCTDGQDLTLYPVFTGEIDPVHFAEEISHAKDTLESCEKKQETPIVLEEVATDKKPDQLDSSGDELLNSGFPNSGFPKLFGQGQGHSVRTSKERKKKFLGYWTQSIADEIDLRTLFVALGQVTPMKFRYEWKKSEEKPSFATDSMKYLRDFCIHEKSLKEAEDINGKIRTIVPKKNENDGVGSPYCAPVETLCLPVNNHDPLPLRPRPGRQRTKRNILNSQMCIPKNRAVNLNMGGDQRPVNAVAVNIIPQAAGLDQFDNNNHQIVQNVTTLDMPTNATLNMSTNGTTLNMSTNGTTLNMSNLYTHPVNGEIPHVEAQVDEESVAAHYKSLTSLLASSALNQNMTTKEIKDFLMLKTPTKKESNGVAEPHSPNLEWLNSESVDVSLSSFLTVNELQVLQERQKNEKSSDFTNGAVVDEANREAHSSFQSLINGLKPNHGTSHVIDPKLPVFHSGDTSQEPFGMMSFDLSSQGDFKGDFKVKEDFG